MGVYYELVLRSWSMSADFGLGREIMRTIHRVILSANTSTRENTYDDENIA